MRPLSFNRFWTGFLLVVFSLIVTGMAHAAPVITTFTALPTSGAAPLSTTLTWVSTGATSCTASGGWSGTKAISGTETVTGITLITTFTIACSNSVQSTATVAYSAPTQRTDGNAILGTLNIELQYGLGTAFDTSIPAPLTGPVVVNGLAPGTYQFRMRAAEVGGSVSDWSNVVTKTVAAAQTATASVTVSPTAPPKPPVILTVTVAEAFQVVKQHGVYNVANQFGTATIGAECKLDPKLGDGYYTLVHPVLDSKPFAGMKRTKYVAVKCAAQQG